VKVVLFPVGELEAKKKIIHQTIAESNSPPLEGLGVVRPQKEPPLTPPKEGNENPQKNNTPKNSRLQFPSPIGARGGCTPKKVYI